MNTTRYILAKYVPDLARMEPRNIGVIVWSKGKFCARFLDKTDIGAIQVNDRDTYERWVVYWSRLVTADAIRPRRGRPVSAADPTSIDALLSTQKGNYILVDSGEMLEQLRRTELQEDQLVSHKSISPDKTFSSLNRYTDENHSTSSE